MYNTLTTLFLPAFLGSVPRRFGFHVFKVTKENIQGVGSLVEEQELKHVLDSICHFTDYIARAKEVIKVVDRIEETITILNEDLDP